MNAIKEARQIITADPNGEESLTLADWCWPWNPRATSLLPASTR